MKDLALPFDSEKIGEIAAQFGTPVYVYDEADLRRTAQRLNKAFDWAPGYKNYFAVKATPTPVILQILKEEDMGFDCSSRAELLMAEKLGAKGEDIFYTSNNTPKEDFELAIKLGATVNIDDLSQVPVFLEALDGQKLARVAARYNPGEGRTGNDIIGQPTEAKYGMDIESLVTAFTLLKDHTITEFGLHTMVVSNELEPGYFAETAGLLLDAVSEIEERAGIKISFINLGGGFGLNYHPDQPPFDIAHAAKEIRETIGKDRSELRIYTENGRYVTGPSGYLISKVRYVMRKHKTYLGLDASMHNLMRPGMYGAYHHITVIGADGRPHQTYDVVGSLCENNDKFAIDRKLPEAKAGDTLVMHDVGAHGHAMGFNYNGLLRSAEVLLKADGTSQLIRKAETVDDYFRNVIWPS
jgi:diaminopimelate decarboxylase